MVQTRHFSSPVLKSCAGDEASARFGVAAAGHALQHHPVHDERARGVAPAFAPVGRLVIPGDLAGLRVQRHEMRIGRGDHQLVLIDRHVALGHVVAGQIDDRLRQVASILPDQVAGRGVQRLHLVGVIPDVEDTVVHDRRALGRTVGQRPGPGNLQVLDVVLGDLVERAEAEAVIGAAPHQPVARVRVAQHLVGDGTHVLRHIGRSRWLGAHRDGSAEDTARAPRWLPCRRWPLSSCR